MARKRKAIAPAFEPINLKLHGAGQYILAQAARYRPEMREVLNKLQAGMEHYPKREIRDYEAATLYVLAAQYNQTGAVIFEIGTCWGWSAAVMAEAAPLAQVVTCTPNPNHVKLARANLGRIGLHERVEVRESRSIDLLPDATFDNLALVFVDGEHGRVMDDMPWFNRLRIGGLMYHHDYTPPWSQLRPCRPVWDTLNAFAHRLRPPDVLIVDECEQGMAGWYRREGDEYWI